MFEEPFYIEDEEIVDDKNIKVAIAFTYDNPNKTQENFKNRLKNCLKNHIYAPPKL